MCTVMPVSANGLGINVKEVCTSRLAQETCTSVTVSCTSCFLYKFLASNTTQLYCVLETCMHVTKTRALIGRLYNAALLLTSRPTKGTMDPEVDIAHRSTVSDFSLIF